MVQGVMCLAGAADRGNIFKNVPFVWAVALELKDRIERSKSHVSYMTSASRV